MQLEGAKEQRAVGMATSKAITANHVMMNKGCDWAIFTLYK